MPPTQRTDATKRKKKKCCKNSETFVRLPQNSQDYSSNWKKLMKNMELTTKNHPPPKHKGRKIVEKTEKKPDIWFDDVDPDLLDPEDRPVVVVNAKANLVKEKSFQGLTKLLALDCEMVGVGFEGKDSILARVSIVNHFGHCVYDKYVRPTEKVTDYRTKVSGIRPDDLRQHGQDFKTVQKEVSDLLNKRVLVGHALSHDLKVLFLDHPRRMIRDTALYKPFRSAFGGKTPSLKNLTARMLGVAVQEGEHSSVQDAQAAMRLYTMFKKQWEADLGTKHSTKKKTESLAKAKSSTCKNADKNIRKQYEDSSDSE